jgi:hypothetical protein
MLGYNGVAAQGPVFQQEQIHRAVELGLGVSSPDKIRLLTPDEESRVYGAQILEALLATG